MRSNVSLSFVALKSAFKWTLCLRFTRITCTITRVIKGKISLQVAHFSLKDTLVVVGGSVGWTHRFVVRWTIIHAYAPGVFGPKCLADSKIITGNIDARIKIYKIQTSTRFELLWVLEAPGKRIPQLCCSCKHIMWQNAGLFFSLVYILKITCKNWHQCSPKTT